MSRHRRHLALASLSALALAISAAPASASPALHETRDLAGLGIVIHCETGDYTIMSGVVTVVIHSNDDFATGHQTITARAVLVQRNDGSGAPAGESYRLVGSESHGMQPSVSNSGPAILDTFKYRIVGTRDSVNLEVHSDGSGGYSVVNRGTCEPAEG